MGERLAASKRFSWQEVVTKKTCAEKGRKNRPLKREVHIDLKGWVWLVLVLSTGKQVVHVF